MKLAHHLIPQEPRQRLRIGLVALGFQDTPGWPCGSRSVAARVPSWTSCIESPLSASKQPTTVPVRQAASQRTDPRESESTRWMYFQWPGSTPEHEVGIALLRLSVHSLPPSLDRAFGAQRSDRRRIETQFAQHLRRCVRRVSARDAPRAFRHTTTRWDSRPALPARHSIRRPARTDPPRASAHRPPFPPTSSSRRRRPGSVERRAGIAKIPALERRVHQLRQRRRILRAARHDRRSADRRSGLRGPAPSSPAGSPFPAAPPQAESSARRA